MSTPIATLYLPGLGGRYDGLRKAAISWWPRKYNAKVIPMNWTGDETYEQKKRRVEALVGECEGQVIIIGESAGAAMGLILAHENPQVSYIGFCGKIGGASSTGEYYFDKIPAFREMLPEADRIRSILSTEAKDRMITVRAYKDIYLSLRDNTLPDVRQIVLPSIGHLTTIILGITLLRYGLLRAVRALSE